MTMHYNLTCTRCNRLLGTTTINTPVTVTCIDRKSCTKRAKSTATIHYKEPTDSLEIKPRYCTTPDLNRYASVSTQIKYVTCKDCKAEYNKPIRQLIRDRLQASAESGIGSKHRRPANV